MRALVVTVAPTPSRPPPAPPDLMENDAARRLGAKQPSASDPSTDGNTALSPTPSRSEAISSPSSSRETRQSPHTPPQSPPAEVTPRKRLSVSVPRDAVGFIIGKRGETVRNMMQKSRAFIAVDRADTDPHAPYRLFHIEGDHQAVVAARALIREKVAAVLHGNPNARVHDATARSLNSSEHRGKRVGAGSGANVSRGISDGSEGSGRAEANQGANVTLQEGTLDDLVEGGVHDDPPLAAPLEMWIPRGCVGMIIGHGGQVINEMQDRAGATIVVHNNKMDRSGAKLLTISGGDREKQHARELIQSVLDRAGLRNRFADNAPSTPSSHPIGIQEPTPWGFVPPQPPIPQAGVPAAQWFFPQLPSAPGFDPRQQMPDFLRYQQMQGGVPLWMQPMPIHPHPGPQLGPGVMPQNQIGQQPLGGTGPTSPTTPPTPHTPQQNLGNQLQQFQQQIQHHNAPRAQHSQQKQPQMPHGDHQQQAQSQLSPSQQQQHHQDQQQYLRNMHPSLGGHMRRATPIQGPSMTPPHINPMYGRHVGAPGLHMGWGAGGQQLAYPGQQQLPVPFDQNTPMSQHPMLKRATKAVCVPSSCVGIVIGRSGETIRDLQQRSGAHIKVTPDRDAHENAQVRLIYISGTPPALDLAHSLVNDVINEGLTRNYRDGVEPRSNADTHEVGGSGVDENDESRGKRVTGRGGEEERDRNVVTPNNGNGRPETGSGRSDAEGSEGATIDYAETFPELDPGPHAANRTTSGQGSGAAESGTNAGPTEGDTEDTNEGEAWKGDNDDRNEQAEEGQGVDQGDDEGAGIGSAFTGEGRLVQRPATDYPSASISFEMKIPHAKVGVIIGKRGATIRALQQQSGARIVVSKRIDTTHEDHPRAVTITGPEAFVDVARRLIVAKINQPPGDPAKPDEYDANPDAFDADEEDNAEDVTVDALAGEFGTHSLSSPVPAVIPGSAASMSSLPMAQAAPYAAYPPPPVQYVAPNQGMPFTGMSPYTGLRSVLRPDAPDFQTMDAIPHPHAHPQFAPQFIGGQQFMEGVPMAQPYVFGQQGESETAGQSYAEYQPPPEQFYGQTGEYFDESGYAYGGEYEGYRQEP